MSLGTPIHRGQAAGTGSTLTTASFTPAAGSLLVANFGRRSATIPPPAPTISDSTARTWTSVPFSPGVLDTGSGVRVRIGASWAIATGAPMTVTASQASGPKTGLIVTEIPGAFTGIANFGSDDDAAGDPTAVMSAPGGASLSLAFGVFTDTSTVSPPSGFTELFEQITNVDLVTETAYKIPATATASWTTPNNTNSLGAIMEISPAGRTRAAHLWFS